VLWAFDLMHLNGNDLRAVHLEGRDRRLGHLIGRSASHAFCILRLRDGERLLETECGKRGLEGVVAKHRAGIYRSKAVYQLDQSEVPNLARGQPGSWSAPFR
jgi:bifunctional non-homologous end joining protein LigD